MRHTPVLTLMALTLAACGSSQTTSSSSHVSHPRSAGSSVLVTPSPPATCRDLALAYVASNGATGHLEVTFSARNTSATACRMQGYPAVRLLDGAGHVLAMHPTRGGGFFPDTQLPARAVLLGPGKRARFAFSFVTNREYAGARICRRVGGAQATLPGSPASGWATLSLSAAPLLSPCGSQLILSPVYV